MARLRYATIYEYRINKKGAECFRSEYRDEIDTKLAALQQKKPNCKFTVQYRTSHRDNHGRINLNWKGQIEWGPWMDC